MNKILIITIVGAMSTGLLGAADNTNMAKNTSDKKTYQTTQHASKTDSTRASSYAKSELETKEGKVMKLSAYLPDLQSQGQQSSLRRTQSGEINRTGSRSDTTDRTQTSTYNRDNVRGETSDSTRTGTYSESNRSGSVAKDPSDLDLDDDTRVNQRTDRSIARTDDRNIGQTSNRSVARSDDRNIGQTSDSDRSDDRNIGQGYDRNLSSSSSFDSQSDLYVLVVENKGTLGFGGGEEAYLLLQDNQAGSGSVAFNEIKQIAGSQDDMSNRWNNMDSDRQNVRGTARVGDDGIDADVDIDSDRHSYSTKSHARITGKVVEKGDLRAILVTDVERINLDQDL